MNNGTGMQTLFFELASWLHLSQTTSGVHDRFLILELNPFPRNTHKWQLCNFEHSQSMSDTLSLD